MKVTIATLKFIYACNQERNRNNASKRISKNEVEIDGIYMGFDEALEYLVDDGMTSIEAINYLCRREVY